MLSVLQKGAVFRSVVGAVLPDEGVAGIGRQLLKEQILSRSSVGHDGRIERLPAEHLLQLFGEGFVLIHPKPHGVRIAQNNDLRKFEVGFPVAEPRRIDAISIRELQIFIDAFPGPQAVKQFGIVPTQVGLIHRNIAQIARIKKVIRGLDAFVLDQSVPDGLKGCVDQHFQKHQHRKDRSPAHPQPARPTTTPAQQAS